MRRLQFPRLMAFILACAVGMSSAGITSFAAEAGSDLSTDVVVQENDTSETSQETSTDAADNTSGDTADKEQTEAPGNEDSGSNTTENTEQFESGTNTNVSSSENSKTGSDSEAETASEGGSNVSTSGDSNNSENIESEEVTTDLQSESSEETVSGSSTETAAGTDTAVSGTSTVGTSTDNTSTDSTSTEDANTDGTTVTAPEDQTQSTPDLNAIEDFTVSFMQTTNPYVMSEGATETLTAKITFTAYSEELTASVKDSIKWTTSSSKIASITLKDPAVKDEVTEITAESDGSGDDPDAAEGNGDDSAEQPKVYEHKVTITQSVTVKAVKEGTAKIKVATSEGSCTKNITVNPIPVKLGKSSELRWTGTAVLHWNAVKNTTKYKIIVYLHNGTKKYSKSLTVQGKKSYDLEDTIVALIKANKSKFKGASYKITASVQALTTNTKYYKNGSSVQSPSLRYMQSTYADAVSRNGWYLRSGYWYYYVAGAKQTGWVTFLSKKYYLDPEGRMKKNCWVSNRYLKEGGEMARDEWVGKYYVDSNGYKVDGKTLNSKKWTNTSKGWRFKKKNGSYAKNQWLKINHAWYYFDKNGYMKTGWLTLNGKKYFLSRSKDISTGRGTMKTGWVKTGGRYYWFDSDGVMAKDEWVDKKQYYVDSNGRRLDWITYDNLRNVSTTNRLGLYVYSSGAAPEQSIAGYEKAYKSGNRIMVCDLRFTKDGIPVLFHDENVEYARNTDGSKPGSRPSVSKLTLSQLNKYDFGIKWGSKYKGTKVLTLEKMAQWIKAHPDTEMYIEVKVNNLTSAQIKKTASILEKYDVTNRSSALFPVSKSSDTRAKRVHNALPTLRIGIYKYTIGNVLYQQLRSAKGPNNDVFVWCWNKTKLDSSIVKKLRSLNAQFESGTMDDFDDIIKYYSRSSAYIYSTSIETEGSVFHKVLKSTTLHDKGKWVSSSKGRKYKQIDGTYARNKWVKVSGKYYHFNSSGIMQTGWLKLSGKKYYLNSKGARVTGTVTISGHKYQFNSSGVLIKKIS